MKKIKQIIFLSLLGFLLAGNIFSAELETGKCSAELVMTQNLKAPKSGADYVRNGKYHWYTKEIVKEADVLQKHLNRLGFNAGFVDGVIGPNTKGAILRLQKFLGTKQDGYIGPETRKLLNNSCGGGNGDFFYNKDAGDKIVKRVEKMIKENVIIAGSCWDYIHEVYNREGYPISKRITIHKGTKNSGPYVDMDTIKAGDWLYFINHSYGDVEHSGIFIKWINKKKNIAKLMSYGGQNRNKPGRYKEYDIEHTYNIMRPNAPRDIKISENSDEKKEVEKTENKTEEKSEKEDEKNTSEKFKSGVCPADLTLTENLKTGDRNGKKSTWGKRTNIISEAHILQKHLNRLGFASGISDGILGPISDGAIKRMQKFLGVSQDGWVGPKTRKIRRCWK